MSDKKHQLEALRRASVAALDIAIEDQGKHGGISSLYEAHFRALVKVRRLESIYADDSPAELSPATLDEIRTVSEELAAIALRIAAWASGRT